MMEQTWDQMYASIPSHVQTTKPHLHDLSRGIECPNCKKVGRAVKREGQRGVQGQYDYS